MNFNFEPLCCKNSSATLLLSKKYVIFLCFMAENDVKRFYWSKHLTSFSAMKHKKDGIFFDKSKVALESFQHRGSKLKFINLERNY